MDWKSTMDRTLIYDDIYMTWGNVSLQWSLAVSDVWRAPAYLSFGFSLWTLACDDLDPHWYSYYSDCLYWVLAIDVTLKLKKKKKNTSKTKKVKNLVRRRLAAVGVVRRAAVRKGCKNRMSGTTPRMKNSMRLVIMMMMMTTMIMMMMMLAPTPRMKNCEVWSISCEER